MMTLMTRAATGAVLMAIMACSSAAQPARTAGASQSAADVVATVGSASVTLEEVDKLAMAQPAGAFGSLSLGQALYEARRAALDQIVATHLMDAEAKARGVERSAIERELAGKIVEPSEVDVAAWYQANQARVQGASLDQVRAPIRQLLLQERGQAIRQQYLDTLMAKTKVSISLEAPRVEVAAAGRPVRGPESAPVEMIEFSDFQCPYCLRAYETVMKVLSTYGDRVKLVYRHFPLPNHPDARPAAEASMCAADQDKFWPYHDRLFANPTKLSTTDLKQHAAALGLNVTEFDRCVNERKHRTAVDEDMAAGEKLGVSGTPAFFINGRPLTGAQPFEAFKRVIDEELATAR